MFYCDEVGDAPGRACLQTLIGALWNETTMTKPNET